MSPPVVPESTILDYDRRISLSERALWRAYILICLAALVRRHPRAQSRQFLLERIPALGFVPLRWLIAPLMRKDYRALAARKEQ